MMSVLVGQHSLQRFSYPINTDEYDEICPILSYTEDYLFLTRVGHPDHTKTLYYDSVDISKTLSADLYEQNLREILYLISGTRSAKAYQNSYNQDVYYATSRKGIVSGVQHPGYPINSALPNSISSTFGPDGDYIIVNQFFTDGSLKPGLSKVNFDGESNFSWPEPIDILKYDNRGGAVNVSMSADGQRMYMSMQGARSRGNHDIYYSAKLTDNIYGEPQNISAVNTPYRESTPFISKDGQRLYFASDRPGGYGGMDIYVCDRTGSGSDDWSEPFRLMAPLNSKYDDTHPYVAEDENTMLFNSNRLGSMDIFRSKVNRDSVLTEQIEIRLRVLDHDGQPVAGEITWTQAYDYVPAFTGFFKPRDGHYSYIIEQNIPHVFFAKRRNRMSQRAIIDPQELLEAGVKVFDVDLYLDLNGKEIVSSIAGDISVLTTKDYPIEDVDVPDAPHSEEVAATPTTPQRYEYDDIDASILDVDGMHTILLRNIYFTRGQSRVLPSSYRMLRKLARVLVENPGAVVQIEGHTDNIGDAKALRQLSRDRANSIREYLIDHEVDPAAVTAIGFGKDHPLNGNENERERKRNRRVEIRVLKGGQGKSN
jgi:outer membrane protein OmpA-like peptidoglycan-associated protein/Tol biopolymer transport system component